MSSIENVFADRKAYIGFLTAGDGGLQRTIDSAMALVAGGVDILEIGVPFSDPVADGPVIQQASQRALVAGTTVEAVLETCATIHEKSGVPLVLFSYFNPLLQRGDRFFTLAAQAGVCGLLVVDLPVDEGQAFFTQAIQHHLDPILLASPSTTAKRLEQIQPLARGFVYYACRKGTTGVRAGLPDDLRDRTDAIRNKLSLPIGVGFGIADRESARGVLEVADGFVVGSRFVEAIGAGVTASALEALARSIDPR